MLHFIILSITYILFALSSNTTKSNLPYISHYKSNNLRLISKMNSSHLSNSVGFFNHLLFNYVNGKFLTKNQHYTIMPILRNTTGYYITILRNKDSSYLFDILNSTPNTQTNTNRLHFELPYNSNNKIYFIVFHVTHVLMKSHSNYSIDSKIDFFTTFEVTKNEISIDFDVQSYKFQHETNYSVFTNEQYLINYLLTSLKSKILSSRNIYAKNIIANNYWKTDQSPFVVNSLEVSRIKNKIEKLCFIATHNYNGELTENQILINVLLKFTFKRGNNELKFNIEYDSILNKNSGDNFIIENDKNEEGVIEIVNNINNEVTKYSLTKISKENQKYINELFKEIKNGK